MKKQLGANASVREFSALTNGRFTFNPDGQVGATDSVHNVFFGMLGTEPVAVKPANTTGDALHEKQMLETVMDLGVTAVKPLCVYERKKGHGAFLVTRRLPQLVSLASLPIGGADQRKAKETEKFITSVAETLAELHAAGVSHGDSQAKNFGLIDRSNPQLIVYDLEKGGTDQIGHKKVEPYAHDLNSLAQSLAYKGFGGPNLDSAATKLEQVVLEPYRQRSTALGFDPVLADQAVESGYGKFIDKSDDLSFQKANGGHDAHRSSRSPSSRR